MSMHSFDDLLAKRFENLRFYLSKNKIEAYRLIDFRNSGIPVAVDMYKENAVIHVFGFFGEDIRKNLEQSLSRIAGAKYFFYKNRTKEDMVLPKSPPKEIKITEYGHLFSINLSDYLDTGIFLDHRETRRWIAAQSKGKSVLNTFAYTGSFSVYAAKAGAVKTHSVDLSRVYCEWIRKNFHLNGIDEKDHWIFKMDAREYFRYAARKHLSFDIIIIDPPTFSRNKGASFSVQKDHPELINAALPLLAPGGFIFFSNNFTDFSINTKKLAPCRIKEEKDTLPPDFAGTHAHRSFLFFQI